MSNNSVNYKIFKVNTKNSYLTINALKTSSNMKYKNSIVSNVKNIPINISYKTINTSSINSTKNKNKLIIPKLIRDSKLENNKNKLEKFESLKSLKSKYFGRNVNNRNYLDINNNYYVNLFNSSTPKYSKIDINKKFNSKENRILINKVKYLNLTNIKNTFNQTFSSNKKKYMFTYTENSEALEKMKNYRNKLLLEFMKYFQRFILLYKKKNFCFLIERIKCFQKKEISYKYIYKKKIQHISRNKDMNKYYSYNNCSKKFLKNKNALNKEVNSNLKPSDNLLKKRKIIINKIINNKSKDVLNEEVRNVFISSNNIDKVNFQKNNINHSFKTTKKTINLFNQNSNKKNNTNVIEIEVNFKSRINNIGTENKII